MTSNQGIRKVGVWIIIGAVAAGSMAAVISGMLH